MLDFDRMPRFKPFHFEIVTRLTEWAETFDTTPAEIERQIGLSWGWIVNNPKKGPKKNIMRYLYNWMLIAQRKGSLLKRPRENFKETKIDENAVMDESDFAKMRAALPPRRKA